MPDKRDHPLLEIVKALCPWWPKVTDILSPRLPEIRKSYADLRHGHPIPLAKIDLAQFRGRQHRKTAIP